MIREFRSPLGVSRRKVLRGLGGVTIGLPFLESLAPRKAGAAEPRRRCLLYYTPGGTVMNKFSPTGTETEFTLGPILSALEPYKNHLVIPQGIDMTVVKLCTGNTDHPDGFQALFTGHHKLAAGLAQGPSIDQLLAPTLSAGLKYASLEMAIRYGTGGGGKVVTISQDSTLNHRGANQPVPPQLDPAKIFDKLFTDVNGDASVAKLLRERKKSILDEVAKRYASRIKRLPPPEQQVLQEHMTKVREVEASLGTAAPTGAMCSKPTLGETARFDDDANIPRTGKQMTDLMVMAMTCDLTRVGTLQWSDGPTKYTLPWLNLLDNHHGYQHDRGYQPEALTTIYSWYAAQFAYLLKSMAEVQEEDGTTLLGNSLILWGSELSQPQSHSKVNIPFVLAGGAAGRLRGKRWLKYKNVPHNNLLLSVLNLMGNPAKTVGHPDHCTGPLAGLV